MNRKQISKLADEPKQEIQFVLASGEIVYLTFQFQMNTNYWYLDIAYKDFEYHGLQVVYTDSLLRQYQNILPFDIEVGSEIGLSPMEIDSFKTGKNRIIIRDSSDEKVSN